MGGNSSVGSKLLAAFATQGLATIGTRRGKGLADLATSPTTSWLSLDLADSESCIDFSEALRGVNYGTVILTIGQLSSSPGAEAESISEMTDYFAQYVARYCWVINKIIEHSGTHLKILHLSSRAAKYGSWDGCYAVAKSSIEVFLRSKLKKTGGDIGTLSIAPGLIEDSRMAEGFSTALLENHRSRAGGKLLSISEVVAQIESLVQDPEIIWDGRVITLGSDYL